MAQRLIIDTDPGVDDMVAIIAALHCSDIELLALTTVGGNVPLETTTRNALRILARVGRLDIPVYAGLSVPHSAAEVHGDDGLAGCPWPDAAAGAQAEPAAEFLSRMLEKGGVTIACLGPLTNLAAVLRARPQLAAGLDRVVLMGGGFGTYSFRADKGLVESRGNMTPEAEFNIYSDVEAAQVVFASGAPVTVMPLDVSQRTLVSLERLARLDPVLAGILDRYTGFSRDRWGHPKGPLHDPNVIARIAEPDLYSGLRGVVRVGAQGRTDLESGDGPHEVMLRVDSEGYLDWVWERLAEAGL
jgi:purine nucleosidase